MRVIATIYDRMREKESQIKKKVNESKVRTHSLSHIEWIRLGTKAWGPVKRQHELVQKH